METSAGIIKELKENVGFNQPVDFMHLCKGVPVVIKGQIQEIREESILFTVEPPDSICLAWDAQTTILQDVFMSGILARVVHFDPVEGTVELDQFVFADRGFGDRAIVRVEPEAPIAAELILEKTSLFCSVVDISLSGFGLLAESAPDGVFSKGQAGSLKLNLAGRAIEITGNLVGVFPQEGGTIRLAMSFTPDTPGQATVSRYITRRRAEIRDGIAQAYQEATQNRA
ncbi:MAG TPA: hypothetical protein DEH25_12680 [Chloroflexi bacterium]|nr:hypothetical protein [Chloroflexota bacterium]HBY07665.1 hypothetical protein [Chloroflexota bacterium]